MRKILSTFIIGTSLAFPAYAAAMSATQTVQKVVEVENPDGTQTVSYVAADRIAPGEKVVYTLNIENDGAQPASDLVLTMPVPNQVKYIEGSSAKVGSVVTYSTDGGKNFTTRDKLRVVSEDGTTRLAQTEDITHIQWKVTGPIHAGELDRLSFQAVLK